MNVLAEYDGAGVLKARYVEGLGVDEPISITRDSTTHYYHFDGLGSVTALTDTNQNITDTYTYEAFGNIVSSTGITENPYRFTARELDSDSELMYYRARYYYPEVGRFVTLDPWIGIITAPLSLNRYVYTQNNPVNLTDPSGYNGHCERCREIYDDCVRNAEEKRESCVYEALESLRECKDTCDIIKEVITKMLCYALCAAIGKGAIQSCKEDYDTRMETCENVKEHCLERCCERNE